jgi:ABC-type dipeptide/oligopeptide/nickel transport system permease subunit
LVSAFFAALLAVPAGVFVFALAAWWEWTGRGLVMLVLGGLCLVRGALLIADLARRDRQLGWWKAHESMGGSWGARLWRYGIGGIWRGAIAELFVFHLKVALAVETALSYLQFGVQEPDPSFGNILASHFEMALHGQWRVLLTVLAGLLLVASLPASLVALLKVAPGARPKEVAHG